MRVPQVSCFEDMGRCAWTDKQRIQCYGCSCSADGVVRRDKGEAGYVGAKSDPFDGQLDASLYGRIGEIRGK